MRFAAPWRPLDFFLRCAGRIFFDANQKVDNSLHCAAKIVTDVQKCTSKDNLQKELGRENLNKIEIFA